MEMLVYELSDDINHIKMHWEFTEIIVKENKNSFFHKYILNMDISPNILYKAFKFIISLNLAILEQIIYHSVEENTIFHSIYIIHHYSNHSCECMCQNITHHPETPYLSLEPILHYAFSILCIG